MRTLLCSYCRCELAQIQVANGRAVAVCLICEEVGNADEVAAGRPIGPAARIRRRPAKARRSAQKR
ncbi:MAG: hypothetical protein OJF62_001027 [Pseudolabrys sp.]|nr:hypothetical protein [Pseudolabrys sp.]